MSNLITKPCPDGAFCSHSKMRFVFCKCSNCWFVKNHKPSAVECPDCGLGWEFGEGIHGYYFAGKK